MDFLDHAVETEVSTTECSFNAEIFLLNSQKKYFLTNVELYLPKIIFWFCPAYAVQVVENSAVHIQGWGGKK